MAKDIRFCLWLTLARLAVSALIVVSGMMLIKNGRTETLFNVRMDYYFN